MYIFSRIWESNGEFDKIGPVVAEVTACIKNETGMTAHAWIGGLGFKIGTVVFTLAYESLQQQSEVRAKLTQSATWLDLTRKIRAFNDGGMQPDTMGRFIRGGSVGEVPVGTVLFTTTQSLAQGADWLAALGWRNEMAEMTEKLTGVKVNVSYTVFGQLGRVTSFMGFPDTAALESMLTKTLADAAWMPKYLEGVKYFAQGSVWNRVLTKFA